MRPTSHVVGTIKCRTLFFKRWQSFLLILLVNLPQNPFCFSVYLVPSPVCLCFCMLFCILTNIYLVYTLCTLYVQYMHNLCKQSKDTGKQGKIPRWLKVQALGSTTYCQYDRWNDLLSLCLGILICRIKFIIMSA